jgi:hypothetical protein
MDLHGFICLLTNTSLKRSIESYDNHEGEFYLFLVFANSFARRLIPSCCICFCNSNRVVYCHGLVLRKNRLK